MNNSATRSKSQLLAETFREANVNVIGFVEACPGNAWSSRTREEGWTLSTAAAHIAMGHIVIARWLLMLGCGIDVAESAADIEALNASYERFTNALSQSEVSERLRVFGAALERSVTDLTQEQLESRAMCLGREWSSEEMVQEAIDHTRGHLEHMMTAAAATG